MRTVLHKTEFDHWQSRNIIRSSAITKQHDHEQR